MFRRETCKHKSVVLLSALFATVASLGGACARHPMVPPRTIEPAANWAIPAWQVDFGEKEFAESMVLTDESLITFLRSDERLNEGIGGSIVALARAGGERQWAIPIPFVQSDVILLLTDHHLLFVVTGTGASAYALNGGGRQWASDLGVGHVEVGALLDRQVLRVYYGDTVFELDSSSGDILSTRPIGSSLWQIGGIDLRKDDSSKVVAFAVDTGLPIWSSQLERFGIDEPWTPQPAGTDFLIVRPVSGKMGACALDLSSGQASWCTGEKPISNISIDTRNSLGWYLRSDFLLVASDLATGAAVRSLQFQPPSLPESMKRERFDYRLSADNHTIAILFGDSNQIFVFEVR